MKNKNVVLGFMVAVAIVLQVLESFIPVPLPIPGGKIGLANIVALIVLIKFGAKEAVVVTLIRAILGSLLHGGFVTMIYSVAGGMFSVVTAILLYRHSKYTIIGIGVMSALVHNLAQVIVAILLMNNIYIVTYYPILMLVSLPCGALTGYVSGLVLNKLK
ncbi:MAG: Gx transporter family protein [Clostridia bacterium]|nr:Gx transporter family protein [Clostridia bacterium]